jgi:hypothetical protein
MAGGLAAGCARRPAPRPKPEPVVTPADASPRQRPSLRYAEGALQPGWIRYEQRKTIRPGETVTAGPHPYAQVKLAEVAENNRSAVFEAAHLVDRRRGRVGVGQHFSEFTPIFGNKGALLEAVGPNGATVVFRWSQGPATPVPPGAVMQPDPAPQTRPAPSP